MTASILSKRYVPVDVNLHSATSKARKNLKKQGVAVAHKSARQIRALAVALAALEAMAVDPKKAKLAGEASVFKTVAKSLGLSSYQVVAQKIEDSTRKEKYLQENLAKLAEQAAPLFERRDPAHLDLLFVLTLGERCQVFTEIFRAKDELDQVLSASFSEREQPLQTPRVRLESDSQSSSSSSSSDGEGS